MDLQDVTVLTLERLCKKFLKELSHTASRVKRKGVNPPLNPNALDSMKTIMALGEGDL